VSKLKELTWENHKKAERNQFAKILMSGDIDPALYAKFLYNQYLCYKALEDLIDLGSLNTIKRATHILDDVWELVNKYKMWDNIPGDYTVTGKGGTFEMLDVTKQYIKHVQDLDRPGQLAHMYVRHFGDMYGGSMIAKRVPGSGKMYQFEEKDMLIAEMRKLLNDDMAPEANRCFEFATKMFEEIVPNVDV